MQQRIQDAIDAVTDNYEAIALGYALCNNGLMNVVARNRPLIIPRAHDCITLFLGSHKRYMREFENEPGTYFKTSGWIERNDTPELAQISIHHKAGMDSTYEQLVEKYGADNADFLFQTLVNNTQHYKRFAYIDMGIEPDDRWETQTRDEAKRRGWQFEKLVGDISLIQRLVDGDWDDDFLIVPPGSHIIPTNDNGVLAVANGSV